MNLSDIVRRKFLPPLMEKGINANVLESRSYKIVPNIGGYSAKLVSSLGLGLGDFFSVKNGLSDDFHYRVGGKYCNSVKIYETEEDASLANWEHFEKYNRSKMLIYDETIRHN